jgi:hypothetical protein
MTRYSLLMRFRSLCRIALVSIFAAMSGSASPQGLSKQNENALEALRQQQGV